VLHADLAWPKDPPPTPLPAVLWIHGGGWVGGSHKPNRAIFLSTHGYFTASVEYRIGRDKRWPAEIEDCKLAVRWLRANAAKYHVDPNCIGCWGASAGGHLVACLGTMDEPRFEGHGGWAGVSSRVQAVVDCCGPADFSYDKKSYGFMGPSYAQNPALYEDASPIHHVRRGDPPFLVVQGEKDEKVDFQHSVRLVAALKKAGVPVEFLPLKEGVHSLGTVAGKPPTKEQNDALEAQVLAFFDKQLKK
jgi:acetyl esterase/lipase